MGRFCNFLHLFTGCCFLTQWWGTTQKWLSPVICPVRPGVNKPESTHTYWVTDVSLSIYQPILVLIALIVWTYTYNQIWYVVDNLFFFHLVSVCVGVYVCVWCCSCCLLHMPGEMWGSSICSTGIQQSVYVTTDPLGGEAQILYQKLANLMLRNLMQT